MPTLQPQLMPPSNEVTLQNVLRAVLNLAPDIDVTRVRQLSYPAWDSLAHVSLIAALESEFGLEIDVSDSVDLTSYQAVLLYIESRGR